MPAMTLVQFAAQSYQSRSPNVSTERCLNLYIEANPPSAKTPTVLYGTPGLRRWTTVGDGPIRGMIELGPRVFVVSGGRLYAVTHDKTVVDVGEIGGSGNVHLTANRTHIGIATSSQSYAANINGVVQLPQSNLNGATYQDGYGIFTQAGGQKFWLTGLDDMTTIGGLDFSTADALADETRGCISDHRDLLVFKSRSTELWYNSGDASFPFARQGAGFIERGCSAHGSIAKADRHVVWLADDLSVVSAAGAQVATLSTPAIQRMISERQDPAGGWAWCYRQEGHVFYVLNFSDLSLCYDLTTGMWHERASSGLGRWRANCYTNIWGRDLVGDCVDGRIYELDLDYYTDDGGTITRQAVAPPINASGGELAYSELYIDCEGGTGLATGQGSIPVAMLDWSDDGGHTWGNIRHSSLGKRGEYRNRLSWTRLGCSAERHFRVTITDPIKVAILGAYARAETR